MVETQVALDHGGFHPPAGGWSRRALQPGFRHDAQQLGGHAIYDLDDYREAQQLGHALRGVKTCGVHYQSVRADGECHGVMRPKAISDAIHWRYLRYRYEQGTIVEVESPDGSGWR